MIVEYLVAPVTTFMYRRSFDGGLTSYELGFEVDIDALLTDAADMAVLAAQAYVSALAMKAAVTLPSWSMSPSTMPRAAGCLMQRRKPWDGSGHASGTPLVLAKRE